MHRCRPFSVPKTNPADNRRGWSGPISHGNQPSVGAGIAKAASPRLSRRTAELGAIGSAELGLVGKPPTVGDIGNGVSAPLCFHLLLAGQQALFPYPTTYRCIGTLEYLMQVAGRNAACSGNNVRSQIRILKVAPDECLDALQMGLLDGRAAAAQRALIGFHRQRQKVHDVLANHLACRSLPFPEDAAATAGHSR